MIRIVIVFVAALLASAIAGKFVIPLLHMLHFGQYEREEGLESHKSKAGTPTMGGIFMLAPTLILIAALTLKEGWVEHIGAVVLTLLTAALGYLDDRTKIKQKHNEGLTPWQKLLAQFVIGFLYGSFVYFTSGSEIYFPIIGFTCRLGLLIIPLVMLAYMGLTNAVNLTDGVDGLCGSVTFIVMAVLSIACIVSMKTFGNIDYYSNVAIFTCGMAGGILGFLVWNLHPAKVFMGDTGSLALGAAVTAAIFMLKAPFIILLIGLVYVVEVLSDIIQVAVYKKTGKRVFKMAPIHHHFEKCGWSEWKVVAVFSGVTVILGAIALIFW